jgi:hypothetical protein
VRDRKHDKQEVLPCLWQSAGWSLSEVRRGKCALIGVLRGLRHGARWSRGISCYQFI